MRRMLPHPRFLFLLILIHSCLLIVTHAAPHHTIPHASTPSAHMELHHLSMYDSPLHPPSTVSFLLFDLILPADQRDGSEMMFRVPSLATEPNENFTSTYSSSSSSFTTLPLSRLHISQLGRDFGVLECGGETTGGSTAVGSKKEKSSQITISMQRADALSHDDAPTSRRDDSTAASQQQHHLSHASSFDHWLIGNQNLEEGESEATRKHSSIRNPTHPTFLLPQVGGHNTTLLSRYIRTLPRIRQLLRDKATKRRTLLLAIPLESHLPYYDIVRMFNASDFMPIRKAGASAASTSRWTCSFTFKSLHTQSAWPMTPLVVGSGSSGRDSNTIIRSRRRTPYHDIPITFTPIQSDVAPRQGVMIQTHKEKSLTMLKRELKESNREMEEMEEERKNQIDGGALPPRPHAYSDSSTPTSTTFLALSSILSIQGPSIKMVLDPVLKMLDESIADQAEHTIDQQVGSRIGTVTPGQVMELTLTKLKDKLKKGIVKDVSTKVMKSLKTSMTEYLSTYLHDEIVHDSTRPLYLALTEVMEKHVRDRILNLVPSAIRAHTPVILHNRLARAITHAVTPSLVHSLNIAHAPVEVQYACIRCAYGSTSNEKQQTLASLFKKPDEFESSQGTRPETGKNHYCSICHSSPERLYYLIYHSTYYSDYYSDYYIPYYTQALIEMEKKRNSEKGRDNQGKNRPAIEKVKWK